GWTSAFGCCAPCGEWLTRCPPACDTVPSLAPRTERPVKPPSLTIGIEEEYQIIDPRTRELKSYITQILEDSKLVLREQVKAELHQSMVEVGTEVCRSPADARNELIRLRREIMGLAGRSGLKIAAAGTHPF